MPRYHNIVTRTAIPVPSAITVLECGGEIIGINSILPDLSGVEMRDILMQAVMFLEHGITQERVANGEAFTTDEEGTPVTEAQVESAIADAVTTASRDHDEMNTDYGTPESAAASSTVELTREPIDEELPPSMRGNGHVIGRGIPVDMVPFAVNKNAPRREHAANNGHAKSAPTRTKDATKPSPRARKGAGKN